MPARRVKTYKKELGHRMHRDHRTHRRPMTKQQAELKRQYKIKKERILFRELDQAAQDIILSSM